MRLKRPSAFRNNFLLLQFCFRNFASLWKKNSRKAFILEFFFYFMNKNIVFHLKQQKRDREKF